MVAISASVAPASYCSPTKIVERHVSNLSFDPRLGERGTEPVLGPGLAVDRKQDDRAPALSGVQRGLERRSYWDRDASACLALFEPDGATIIGGPGEAQEVALPLACPEGHKDRQV